MCLPYTHDAQPEVHLLAHQPGLCCAGVGHWGPVHNILQYRPAVHPSGGALHRQQLRLLRACCKPPCSGTCPCSLASSTHPQPSRSQPSRSQPSCCQPSSWPTAACQLAGGACDGQKHHKRHRLRLAHGGARGPAHILRLERHGRCVLPRRPDCSSMCGTAKGVLTDHLRAAPSRDLVTGEIGLPPHASHADVQSAGLHGPRALNVVRSVSCLVPLCELRPQAS